MFNVPEEQTENPFGDEEFIPQDSCEDGPVWGEDVETDTHTDEFERDWKNALRFS